MFYIDPSTKLKDELSLEIDAPTEIRLSYLRVKI